MRDTVFIPRRILDPPRAASLGRVGWIIGLIACGAVGAASAGAPVWGFLGIAVVGLWGVAFSRPLWITWLAMGLLPVIPRELLSYDPGPGAIELTHDRLIVAVLLAGLTARLAIPARMTLRRSGALLPLALFAFWTLLSARLALRPRPEALLVNVYPVWLSLILFACLVQYSSTFADIRRGLIVMALSATAVCALALVEWRLGYNPYFPGVVFWDREGLTTLKATFGANLVFGGYLVLLIPVAVSVLTLLRGLLGRAAAALALVVQLFCIFHTYSRTAWAGLLAGTAVLARNRREILWGGLALALVLTLPPVQSKVVRIVGSRIGSFTTLHRLQMVQIAAHVMAEHPIQGVGVGNFELISPDYRFTIGTRVYQRFSKFVPTTDNTYLSTATELGLIGLILQLWALGIVMRHVLHLSSDRTIDPVVRHIAAGLLAGLSGFLICGLAFNTFQWLPLGTAFWAVAGLSEALWLHTGSPSAERLE